MAGWVEALAGADQKFVQTIGSVHVGTTTSAGGKSATLARCQNLMAVVVAEAEVEVIAGPHEVVDTEMTEAMEEEVTEERDKRVMEVAEVVGRCVAHLAGEIDTDHTESSPISDLHFINHYCYPYVMVLSYII